MANVPQQLASSPGTLLAEAADWAVRSLVAGDRELRRNALLVPGTTPTTRYFARRLAARVAVFGHWTKNRELLFGLLKTSQRNRAAEVRLELALQPSPDRTDTRSQWLVPVFRPPGFLLNPGEPGTLMLVLNDGRRMRVRLDAAGIRARIDDSQEFPLTAWPHAWTQHLLDTLHGDLALPAATPGIQFDLLTGDDPGDNSLDGLIGAMFRHYDALCLTLSDACRADPGHLAGALPPAYLLQQLQGRVKAWIDSRGRIIAHAEAADGLQVDLRVRIGELTQGACAVFEMYPIGRLDDVSLQQRFLQALSRRAEDLARQRGFQRLFRQFPDPVLDPDGFAIAVAELQDFLQAPDLTAHLIRLEAGGLELVRLSGTYRRRPGTLEMVLPMALEDDGDVRVDVRAAQFLTSTLHGTDVQGHGPAALRLGEPRAAALRGHVERTLRHWDAWQRRMARG